MLQIFLLQSIQHGMIFFMTSRSDFFFFKTFEVDFQTSKCLIRKLRGSDREQHIVFFFDMPAQKIDIRNRRFLQGACGAIVTRSDIF